MAQFNKLFALVIIVVATSCHTISQSSITGNEGRVVKTTRFYNNNGDTVFNYPLEVWYRDSTAIELITGFHSFMDTNNVLTYSNPLQFCRYIDLKKDSMYDFLSFSDTAMLLRSGRLSDSIMKLAGWVFYSKKVRTLNGEPSFIGDTTIDGKTWKLGIFRFKGIDDSHPNKLVGFFRCGEPHTWFALEHGYYEKSGCRMDRCLDYTPGQISPSGDIEITHEVMRLPDTVRAVYDAWDKRLNTN